MPAPKLVALDRSADFSDAGHSENPELLNRLAADISKHSWCEALRAVGLPDEKIALAWDKFSGAERGEFQGELSTTAPPVPGVLVGQIAEQMSLGEQLCDRCGRGFLFGGDRTRSPSPAKRTFRYWWSPEGLEIIHGPRHSQRAATSEFSEQESSFDGLSCKGLVMFALKRLACAA